MTGHQEYEMKKGATYRIIVPKYTEGHNINHIINAQDNKCGEEVINLLGGKRIWTRVQFACGDIIKINCACLEKV